jgi:hypothetical protein
LSFHKWIEWWYERLLKWIWAMASFKSFYCLFKWNEMKMKLNRQKKILDKWVLQSIVFILFYFSFKLKSYNKYNVSRTTRWDISQNDHCKWKWKSKIKWQNESWTHLTSLSPFTNSSSYNFFQRLFYFEIFFIFLFDFNESKPEIWD